MDTEDAYLALNLLPKVGPVRARRLINHFGDPTSALQARADAIRKVEGFGPDISNVVSRWEDHVDLGAERDKIRDRGLNLLTPESAFYPALLKSIHDPPLVLYVWGELKDEDRHGVGVVGCRRATHYGIQTARKLSFQLAHAGLTIVSGLAKGIDTAAHEGAIAARGRTVAVLGSGLGKLYPAENMELATRIADGHGAVISEFPVDYPPDRQSFPLRNRIVSGWCFGTIVVEAPTRSGALITAGQALDQGRAVYAVPGPIDRPSSGGTNRLIQQGAKLITSGEDVLEDIDSLFPTAPVTPDRETVPARVELSGDEKTVYAALGEEEMGMDDIIDATGLPSATVSPTLMRLEMKRLVKQLPGQRFVKLV